MMSSSRAFRSSRTYAAHPDTSSANGVPPMWMQRGASFLQQIAAAREMTYRDLPTGITVDAGRVHEEVARDVFRHSLFEICHDRAFSCWLSVAPILHPPDSLASMTS